MAQFFLKGKRKRAICALSVALSATFSLALFASCGGNKTTEPDDEEETQAAVTDTQLLKNGNFEFYTEQLEKLDDKRNFISTPTSWTFTSGSPSSDTRSGLIETDEWDYMATSGREFTSIDDAYAHWNDEDVHLYDRLRFLERVTEKEEKDGFKETYDALSSSSKEKKLFSEYSYSIDFEDVEDLSTDFPEGIELHEREEDDEEDGTAMLMIHNRRDSDGVLGTAQYYTSSTTITLEAGTAAEITGWVRTDHLKHYYSANDVDVTRRGGAYIGVINTVGGTTLEEMQVKNINTQGEWQQYTLYVRASTFASTTFRLKLGLGQGTSSDNRYENVNGYAFFDDFRITKIAANDYVAETKDLAPAVKCDIGSAKKDKLFDVSDPDSDCKDQSVFALDLYADESYTAFVPEEGTNVTVGLTTELSGSNTYESKIKDNRSDEGTPDSQKSIVGVRTYAELEELAKSNGYLENILKDDFDKKFPFYGADGETVNTALPVLMILSTNSAAYTAKVSDSIFSLEKDGRMLVSFFVKTSDIRSGKSGAGVAIIDDAGTRTVISPFDSNDVATVDIDKEVEELSDIYKGWVQCFFFVSNDTDETRTFRLEFTYGPTSVASSSTSDYAQGYAAFTGFEYTTLTKTQYSYATTGDRAKKVSLTASVADTTKFDDAQASSDIEHKLATPSSFTGKLAGSKAFLEDEDAPDNKLPEGVYSGLLNFDYRENYDVPENADWMTKLKEIANASAIGNADWWRNVFGDVNNTAVGSQQPLIFVNTTDTPVSSYGFIAANTSLSANSSRKIGLRVKLGANTTVNVYLVDTTKASTDKLLSPDLPKVTYWYDDDGNIVKSDPTEKDFDEKTGILYYLEENGLYTKADANDGKYYANLHNYDTDEDGNYVTREETPVTVFYRNPDDNKIYAYREEIGQDKYEYTVEVENLPTDIARYVAPEDLTPYDSKITIVGDEAHKDSWTDVAFYVRTGSEAKNYRVEIWVGERGTAADEKVPAGAYAFFDTYNGSASVSDYEGQRKLSVDALLETEANRLEGDDEKLNSSFALYYTYTLYDAADFLRYDKTTDEDGVDWWGQYDQSSRTENIVWLKAYDEDGAIAGGRALSVWLDFTAIDQTVDRDTADDTDTSTPDTDTSTPSGDTNPWLIVSSALLGAVTLFAVAALLVRFLGKKFKKNKSPKPKKQRTPKPKKDKSEQPDKAEEPEPEPEAPAPADDNPYDE